MRPAGLLPYLLLAGCGQPTGEPQTQEREVYRSGRDGLCLADGRAGLIAYGPGDTNCSVSGSARGSGNGLAIIPSGDEHCRIEVRIAGDRAILGHRSDQCAYYCGPGADYSGRVLQRSTDSDPVTDLAGDSLC